VLDVELVLFLTTATVGLTKAMDESKEPSIKHEGWLTGEDLPAMRVDIVLLTDRRHSTRKLVPADEQTTRCDPEKGIGGQDVIPTNEQKMGDESADKQGNRILSWQITWRTGYGPGRCIRGGHSELNDE